MKLVILIKKNILYLKKVRVIAHHLGIDFFDDDTESDESDEEHDLKISQIKFC